MKDIYFELRNNMVFKFGKVVNIPENISFETVKKRIEVNENGESIIIIDNKIDDSLVDVVFDWITLDFETGIDEELIYLNELLEKSIEMGIEDNVVYSALSIMKKNPTKSISDVMKMSFENLTK